MNKRQIQEGKEGLEQVVNNAPSSRFQNEQQIQNTGDVNAKTEPASFSLKKNDGKGSQLKQEAVAKVIKSDEAFGGSVSGMGISAAGTRGVSGAMGGVLGAANGTPIADKSRKDSRYGKKLDRIGTKLNFTPSEQVLEDFDESKPLAESKDSDQGYNGTYRNEYARSQKKVGNTPAELMFQRSVDYISKDQLYFGQGQYVKQTGVTAKDAPTATLKANAYGIMDYERDQYGNLIHNYNIKPGNYLHRKIYVTLDQYGKVTDLYFDVEDLTPTVDAETANRSSAAAIIDRNVAELDRQSMDAKAGDEKADIWTPLARAVEQPTQVVALLRDLEAMTGGEVLISYRKASTSMAHQLNRATKDGQTIVDPAVEAIIGLLEDANQTSVLATAYPKLADVLTSSESNVKALNAAGCSGLMIQAYDSTPKYSTKQDVLLQPRSFRMHLQTADNNMNVLRVHKRFAQAIDSNEVYSTIDRSYDPLMPICISDKAAVIYRYNFNELYGHRKVTKGYQLTETVGGSPNFATVLLTEGKLNASGVETSYYAHVMMSDNTTGHSEFKANSSNPHIFEPKSSVNAPSGSNKIIVIIDTSSTQIVSKTIEGTTYYEQQSPFALTKGESYYLNIPASAINHVTEDEWAWNAGVYKYGYADLRNSYVVKAAFPLLAGIEKYFEDSIGAKVYGLLPSNNKTLSIPMVHSTEYFSLWSFIVCAATPYIVSERINSMRDVLYYEKNVEYPFSQLTTIGEIGVKSYSNFNFIDYDNAIEVGTMKPATALKWVMPEMFWKPYAKRVNGKVTEELVVMPFYMNQENFKFTSDETATVDLDKAAMTMPSIRSGARLAFLDMLYSMSEKDLRLSYDCVVPFIPTKAAKAYAYKYGQNSDGIVTFFMTTSDTQDADITISEWLSQPREIGYIMDAPYGVLTPKVTGSITAGTISSGVASFSESATRGTSFRIRCYAGKDFLYNTLSDNTEKILQATAINVNRAANYSQVWYKVVSNGKRPTFDAGMLFSLNHLLSSGSFSIGESIFTPFINEVANTQPSAGSALSTMKAVWTRLQKLPFVISPFEGLDMDADGTASTSFDPFDFAYFFGMCGTRASDYRESVYNREKEVVNQGHLFVTDPWLEASPIFKEGAISSGITVTKGYEI